MTNCLVLTHDPEFFRRIQNGLETFPLSCTLFDPAPADSQQLILSELILAVIDTHFQWRAARSILPLLEEQKVPVLFICSSAHQQKHLLQLYSGKCDALPTGCSAAALRESLATLLEKESGTLTLGSLELNTEYHTVSLDGSAVPLTLQEFRLLHVLMRNPNTLMTREDLLRKAWDYPASCITRTVDIHIGRLRKKIGNQWIQTVHCSGYRLHVCE
jgi:DNA-binding response OmpR family regulator